MEVATLAGGCFWCTEAVFKRLKGVEKVESGYAGGTMDNPSYEEVSTGQTEHAEALQITFNPKVISFETLLDVFWHIFDPTTLNQQGADVGTQYRSLIFYHSAEQKQQAEKSRATHQKDFKDPIVTEIVPFTNFYQADDYHQNYYEKNHDKNAYCPIVIDPKIRKLMTEFKDLVKTS